MSRPQWMGPGGIRGGHYEEPYPGGYKVKVWWADGPCDENRYRTRAMAENMFVHAQTTSCVKVQVIGLDAKYRDSKLLNEWVA